MLLKKLADLASHLDKHGHYDEASQVDAIIRFIMAEVQCACDCAGCKKEDRHECGCQACMMNDDSMCACD